jgi:hypothetical protein
MDMLEEKIIKKAKEILENSHNGIRFKELVQQIQKAYPDIKAKRIEWTVYDLHRKDENILKPERGVFILKKYYMGIGKKGLKETKKEEDFYEPFADYLKNELKECTNAIPLGGNKFQDKWGTPDVIGVKKFLETEPIKPLPEIISAEIKININQLITAFGQACSYKLFSNKVYLVIPDDAPKTDIERLESLCLKFGIGLITFKKSNPKNPDFKIITRAMRSEPDYFYVNQYLKKLGKDKLGKDIEKQLF